MVGYFHESENVKSVTRIVFFVGALWTMALSTFFAFSDIAPMIVLAYFTGSLGALVGMKLGQKPMEGQKK